MVDKVPPLTKKKRRWAENRDVTLRGLKLAHNAALELRYARELKKLTSQMTKETKKLITDLFRGQVGVDFFRHQEQASALDSSINKKRTRKKKNITQDESLGSQSRILMNYLTNKFTKLFASKAKSLSMLMFTGAEKVSKTNLHASLKQLSGGLSLKTGVVPKGFEDVAQATIAENVSLIKSIPEKYFTSVTGSVMRSITEGRGLQDLIPEIQKYDGQTERRAENIALDQTRKAYNTINKQKMQALGITQFEWLHTKGSQSPRESHLKISGHIFSFENLEAEQAALGVPERDRGLPSVPPNCRCTILPVIDFDDE